MESEDSKNTKESAKTLVNTEYSGLAARLENVLTGDWPLIERRVSVLQAAVVLSLTTALCSAFALVAFGLTHWSLVHFVFPLSAAWTLIVLIAVLRCGVRGLWTLAGLPFAVYWPALDAFLYIACKWGHDCI